MEYYCNIVLYFYICISNHVMSSEPVLARTLGGAAPPKNITEVQKGRYPDTSGTHGRT